MLCPWNRAKVSILIYLSNHSSLIGQDHTLWSWGAMDHEGKEEIRISYENEQAQTSAIDLLTDNIENFWNGMTATGKTHQLQCELYRNEEINLYYQCTQNAYNNYALDHFGGDQRSYPRWLSEVYRCNVELEEAEIHTVVDENHEDKEFPCETETAYTLPMPFPFVYHAAQVARFDRATTGTQAGDHVSALSF